MLHPLWDWYSWEWWMISHRWKSHTPVVIFILSDPLSNSELLSVVLIWVSQHLGCHHLPQWNAPAFPFAVLKASPARRLINKHHDQQFHRCSPKKLFGKLKYNAEYPGASILSSRRSSRPVPTNMKCRQCLIWDVMVHGNLSEILTSSWKFPCRRLVLKQHSSIILLSCFEVELTASGWSYSGKALMLLQKARLLSGYN